MPLWCNPCGNLAVLSTAPNPCRNLAVLVLRTLRVIAICAASFLGSRVDFSGVFAICNLRERFASFCAFRARVLHCHCHQSKRYSGGMRSAHGVQRATVGSFQLSSFDYFQAATRSQHGHCLITSWSILVTRSAVATAPESRKPDTWPGFDLVQLVVSA